MMRRRITIRREDHLNDSLGAIFFEPPEGREDAILERLRGYLSERVKIVRGEIKSKTALVEIEARGFPEESERLVEEARLLWKSGGRKTARSLLRDALALDPLNANALRTLGGVLSDLGENAEALCQLKRAREFGAESPDLLRELAATCLKLEHKASAIAYLKAALQLDPTNFNTLRQLRTLGYRRQAAAGERHCEESATPKPSRVKPAS